MVVLTSWVSADELAAEARCLIAETFGLTLEVVVRTRAELARVVSRNPLGNVATNPKRYQVTFLAERPARTLVHRLEALAAPSERFAAIGRELYAWHPQGVARSRLWAELGSPRLGVTATSRNWTTVTSLLELADDVRA
jgi:uncharacterized protein (DUF1697 family)